MYGFYTLNHIHLHIHVHPSIHHKNQSLQLILTSSFLSNYTLKEVVRHITDVPYTTHSVIVVFKNCNISKW